MTATEIPPGFKWKPFGFGICAGCSPSKRVCLGAKSLCGVSDTSHLGLPVPPCSPGLGCPHTHEMMPRLWEHCPGLPLLALGPGSGREGWLQSMKHLTLPPSGPSSLEPAPHLHPESPQAD